MVCFNKVIWVIKIVCIGNIVKMVILWDCYWLIIKFKSKVYGVC